MLLSLSGRGLEGFKISEESRGVEERLMGDYICVVELLIDDLAAGSNGEPSQQK